MPELDSPHASMKLEIEEASILQNEENEVSAATTINQRVPTADSESQLTLPPSCEIAQGRPCPQQDVTPAPSTSVPVIVNPEASSTPVKSCSKVCTDENLENASLSASMEASCSPIKSVNSETDHSEDEQDDLFEDEDEKGNLLEFRSRSAQSRLIKSISVVVILSLICVCIVFLIHVLFIEILHF